MRTLRFCRSDVYRDREGEWLALLVENTGTLHKLVDELQDGKEYVAEVKERRERRSLDANAYCWVLMGKLAEATGQDVTDIYRTCIREIGGNYEALPIREDAVERWMQIWGAKGMGWVAEELGPCRTLQGYRTIICYYGSSVYDKAQMSRLIDRVVAECKEQGIETETPDRLALLKEGWGA